MSDIGQNLIMLICKKKFQFKMLAFWLNFFIKIYHGSLIKLSRQQGTISTQDNPVLLHHME